MKSFLICLLVFAIHLCGYARLMKGWSYQEMFDAADLVVIAHPGTTTDTAEKADQPRRPIWDVVGQETEFKVKLVTKGDKDLKAFVLHHYRLRNPQQMLKNGPKFVSFDSKKHESYLLFLKKEGDGRYAPVSGQDDPGLFSVLKLEGIAQ